MTVDTTVQELEQRLKDCTHDLTTLLALRQMTFDRMTDPTSFVWLITDEARQLTSTDFGAIFLLDDEVVSCAAAALLGEAYPTMEGNCPLPLRQTVIELAIQTGQPICITEVRHDPRVNADFVRHAGIQSLLVVPFKFDPEPAGVIVVGNEQVRTFSRYDERALELLAPNLIIGLKAAQLYRQEQERRREAEQRRRVAEGLGDILAMLNSHHSLDETLDYIAVQAGQLLGSGAVAIFRLDPEALRVLMQAARHEPAPGWDLTPREREVLELMVAGLNNPQIAARLTTSRSTIKTHVSSILSKLGVASRAEAIRLALQHHLIT